MFIRWIARNCLLVFVMLLLHVSVHAQNLSDLQQLLLEADQNPALQSAFAQIAVAESRIKQQNSLPDPVLSLSLQSYPLDSFSTNQSPMTGNEVRLAQKFPFPGKLKTKEKIAIEKQRWYSAAYQDARLQLRGQVKDAWFRLLYLRQAVELTDRNLQLLDDFTRLTETRYAVGKGLQQAVLKAQLQYSKQLREKIDLQQNMEMTVAELNSLVGRNTDEKLETEVTLVAHKGTYQLATLRQQVEQNRPIFEAYASLIDQYKAQSQLAKLDYKPDFTLWSSYRWRDDSLADSGTDFVSVGISFNLPLRKESRSAAVAEAESSVRLAYQQANDFRNQVDLSLQQTFIRYQQAGELIELYSGGIIPQANQTFQATLSAYQVDQVGFLELLDSLMSLYRYQIEYVKAMSDQQRSFSQIEAAVGLNIDQQPEQQDTTKR